jgi:hypothetical protein
MIAPESRRRLESAAKALFYRDRSYAAMLEAGRRQGLPPRELARLEDFLATDAIDLKRADARLLLEEMRKRLATGLAPKSVAFTFEHTSLWERATQLAAARPR